MLNDVVKAVVKTATPSKFKSSSEYLYLYQLNPLGNSEVGIFIIPFADKDTEKI